MSDVIVLNGAKIDKMSDVIVLNGAKIDKMSDVIAFSKTTIKSRQTTLAGNCLEIEYILQKNRL